MYLSGSLAVCCRQRLCMRQLLQARQQVLLHTPQQLCHRGRGAEVDRLRPSNATSDAFAARVNAGTAEDHIGRFRNLTEAGVHTAIINMPDLSSTEPITAFAPVIEAFRQ